jgi:hypothetical protein
MLAVNRCPFPLAGYTGILVQNTPSMLDTQIWTSMLSSLHSQRCYLNDLLSKTAITLNVLRERRTRNERALSKSPTPRSKRKKIQQNRWRTNRTIQTCENEERVILDCLKVCNSNINILETIVNPQVPSSTVFDYTSSNSMVDSGPNSFDWGGWTDDTPVSPFVKTRVRSLPMEEISPETPLSKTEFDSPSPGSTRRPSPQATRSPAGAATLPPLVPSDPVNPAFTHFEETLFRDEFSSVLSPEAAAFEPSLTRRQSDDNELPRKLDKLSISGLLASKCMQHKSL